MKHIQKMDLFGSSNVGLYLAASDTYTIAGISIIESDIQKITSVLQTPVLQTTVCGTSLVGLFLSITDEYIFVPDLAFESEIEKLRSTNLTVVVVPTKLTALGNNMLYANGVLFVSMEFEQSAIESITEQVPVKKVHRVEIADTDVIGSCIVTNAKGGIVHPFADDTLLDLLEDALQIPLTKATVSQNSPYVKSGVVVNSNGFIVGQMTSGPELVHIDEALGFLQTQ